MREKPAISDEQILSALQHQFDIPAVTLEFLGLGLDINAGVYRANCTDGASFVLKVRRGSLYEPSCVLPRYLADLGIAGVLAPLRTPRDTLWAEVGEWRISVYPFVEGDAAKFLDMSDANWRDVGMTVRAMHAAPLPPGGFPLLRVETFDPGGYIRWLQAFEAEHVPGGGRNEAERAFIAIWMEQRAPIQRMLAIMDELGRRLREQSGPRVICHADLHANNILRDLADRVYVIDWDDVMLAPRERDFIFVGTRDRDRSYLLDAAPFFQGYGAVDIDQAALTYYWCERVITDVIEDARWVFLTPDLEDESRTRAVEAFRSYFDGSSMLDAIWEGAASLSPDTRIRSG